VLYGFNFTNSASQMNVTGFSTGTVTVNVTADAVAVDLPNDPGGAAVVM
jgi:hypothetical protein